MRPSRLLNLVALVSFSCLACACAGTGAIEDDVGFEEEDDGVAPSAAQPPPADEDDLAPPPAPPSSALSPCGGTDDFDGNFPSDRWFVDDGEGGEVDGAATLRVHQGHRTAAYLRTRPTLDECYVAITVGAGTARSGVFAGALEAPGPRFAVVTGPDPDDDTTVEIGGVDEKRVVVAHERKVVLGVAFYEGHVFAGFFDATWRMWHVGRTRDVIDPNDHELGFVAARDHDEGDPEEASFAAWSTDDVAPAIATDDLDRLRDLVVFDEGRAYRDRARMIWK